jgi:hypothetical protein
MRFETPAYHVTGSVVRADALLIDRGSGLREVGSDLELSVRGDVVYARVTDLAATLFAGSVATVHGTFEHIDDYEVDEFPRQWSRLVDRRGSELDCWGFTHLGPAYVKDGLMPLSGTFTCRLADTRRAGGDWRPLMGLAAMKCRNRQDDGGDPSGVPAPAKDVGGVESEAVLGAVHAAGEPLTFVGTDERNR